MGGFSFLRGERARGGAAAPPGARRLWFRHLHLVAAAAASPPPGRRRVKEEWRDMPGDLLQEGVRQETWVGSPFCGRGAAGVQRGVTRRKRSVALATIEG